MATLLFYDTDHTYTVDGEQVPSVSELTRFISREIYGDITQFTLDRAAGRGTKVHKETEVLDKYGKCEVDEDIAPYIRAYLKFRKDHECEWQQIEWPTYHPDKLYAGTLDRYGTVDGEPCIVDIKSTKNIGSAHRQLYTAQLNLYRQMIESFLPVSKLYVIQLKEDETYKLIEIAIDDALPAACITLHQALKKKRRKRKEDTVNG